MTGFHTHYDNLKVIRSAPTEVIKAAYKGLAQKYHPDKYVSEHDKLKASKAMQVINDSLSVLTDPVKRARHDEWIKQQEILEQSAKLVPNIASNKTVVITVDYGKAFKKFNEVKKSISESIIGTYRFLNNLLRSILIIACFTIPLIAYNLMQDNQPSPISQTAVNKARSNPSPEVNKTTKKAVQPRRLAPNGKPFPNRPLYLEGYPKLNADGLSTITVDNTQNSSDIFGKLIYLDNGNSQAVRYFFIPAHGGFILRDVTAGNYDIRYKDLSDGQIAKSEPFEAQEIEDETGKQFSNITMTLYKVANGNMQTTPISESEFN